MICAIADAKATWIASNTSCITGDGRVIICGPLWYIHERWAVGQTGDARTGDILKECLSELFDNLDGPFAFTERLRSILERYGYKGSHGNDDSVPCYGSSYILAGAGKLWDIDTSFDITEYPSREMVARGSGGHYALGVWYALKDTPTKPSKILDMAVRAAIANDVNCGGEPWVRQLKG